MCITASLHVNQWVNNNNIIIAHSYEVADVCASIMRFHKLSKIKLALFPPHSVVCARFL
jgi:hypothetical protein